MGFELAHARVCPRRLGERLQDIAASEGRRLARQPARARELSRNPLASISVAGARRPGLPDDRSHSVAAQAMLGRSSPPVPPGAGQEVPRSPCGGASQASRPALREPSTRRAEPCARGSLPVAGRMLDHTTRHADEVRRPALDRMPAHAKPLGQLRAQRRLVEVVGGLRVAVQRAAIERGPGPVRALRDVRDDDVCRSGSPAREQRCSNAAATKPAQHDRRAAMAAPRPTGRALEIAERLADRGLMRRAALLRDAFVGESRTPRPRSSALGTSHRSPPRTRHGRLPEGAAGRRVLAAQQPLVGGAAANGAVPGCGESGGARDARGYDVRL